MPFKKGVVTNPSGRKVGTPNLTTGQLREHLQKFINDNLCSLQKDFDSLEPEKRLSFLEKVINKILPPPVNPDQLTESQLHQIIDHLKRQENEK